MTLTLVMILRLASGQIAEQPASIAECEMVEAALTRGELVEIDADDGYRHRVIGAECRLSDAYVGPCEEGA